MLNVSIRNFRVGEGEKKRLVNFEKMRMIAKEVREEGRSKARFYVQIFRHGIHEGAYVGNPVMRERRFFPPPLCNGVQNLPGGIDIEDIFRNCVHTEPYRKQQKKWNCRSW